jgi:hypothetical protein
MRLSVFVAALGWASVFVESWLWLLGAVKIDGLRIGLYVLFWLLALLGGIWAVGSERKAPG